MTTSHDAHPARRSLSISKGQTGPDVEALQRAANRVLGNFPNIQGGHKCTVDGAFGPDTAEAVSRALYLEGADVSTYRRAQVKHGGHVSVHAQNFVRHPGIRVARNFEAQRKRVDALRRALAEEASTAFEHSKIAVAIQAAELGLKHAPRLHYTQGPQRWDGINRHLYAAHGAYPLYADCSSFYTWCLWNLLGQGEDVVNGAEWLAGYTGTLLTHGKLVHNLAAGVAVIYGAGWPGKHVAIATGDGKKVISHGSEGGPYLLDYDYRPDVMEFRAFV